MAYKLSAITAKLNPNSTNSTQPIPTDKQKNNKIDKKLKQQQISTFCVPCDTRDTEPSISKLDGSLPVKNPTM